MEKLKRIIEVSLDAGKAEDIVAIDLAGKSSLADYFIIATGTSQRHIASLADNLAEKLESAGLRVLSITGQENGEWVVLDSGHVMVHLFKPEVRPLYNLEKMWQADIPVAEAAM